MKQFSTIVVSLTFGLGLTAVTAGAQQAPVNLGSNFTFAVLAGTTVTVTGGGTIAGNIGIFPGTAYVAGTPPVTVDGTVYAGGPVAAQAQTDLTTAFNDAAGRSVDPVAVAGNIGGQTLPPGLYKSTSSLAISSGDLTLDAQGNANAVWIFQIASTLTTTSGRQIILAGGASAANIFWQVGSSATIGTTSVFQGNILAGASISMLTGSTLTGRALAIAGAVSIDTGGGSSATIPPSPLQFYPVAPCRIADTRSFAGMTGAFGPPSMDAQSTRDFPVPTSACNIPSTAEAYALNITAVPTGSTMRWLTTWPTGRNQPVASTLNSYNGVVTANAALVPAGTNGAISIFVSDATDVVLDIDGYFAAPVSGGLDFYAATPCRIADTRAFAGMTGAFGPPSMAAQSTRSFPVLSSSCSVPSTAVAYSLNMTVVPSGSTMRWLTTWPTGQTEPVASTLNSYDGVVTANAALVPAGTSGSISVFVSDATDFLFDYNGYFAPEISSGLRFYPVTPCRVADTRASGGFSGAEGPPWMSTQSTRSFPVAGSCGIPATAVAYSLNMTAAPTTNYLGWLTTWPTGQAQPVASTLNSWDGQVKANAAIVPAGTNGEISIYVSDATDVLFDINGYFAP